MRNLLDIFLLCYFLVVADSVQSLLLLVYLTNQIKWPLSLLLLAITVLRKSILVQYRALIFKYIIIALLRKSFLVKVHFSRVYYTNHIMHSPALIRSSILIQYRRNFLIYFS